MKTEEKIKRLEMMVKSFKEAMNATLFDIRTRYICTLYMDMFQNGGVESMLFVDIPELLKHKPKKLHSYTIWFGMNDIKSRIYVLQKTIADLKRTL